MFGTRLCSGVKLGLIARMWEGFHYRTPLELVNRLKQGSGSCQQMQYVVWNAIWKLFTKSSAWCTNINDYEVKYSERFCYNSVNVCCFTLSLNNTDLRLESFATPLQPMLLMLLPFIIQALQIRYDAWLQCNVSTSKLIMIFFFSKTKVNLSEL